jgi:alpha-1,3-glucosyltransferase
MHIFQFIYSAIALLHLAELLFTPPARYPDLFPVLNALLCADVFGLAYLWSLKRLVELSWAMGSLGNTSGGSAASRTGRPPPSPLDMAGNPSSTHSNGKSRDRVASLSLSSSLRRRNPVGRPTLGVDIPFESREENVVDLSEPLGMHAS